jgi:hypothetical protein
LGPLSCRFASAAEIAAITAMTITSAMPEGTRCSYSSDDHDYKTVQIDTFPADQHRFRVDPDLDGQPVPGIGIRASRGATGLYVEADAIHGFSVSVAGGATDPSVAELAIARVVLPRLEPREDVLGNVARCGRASTGCAPDVSGDLGR